MTGGQARMTGGPRRPADGYANRGKQLEEALDQMHAVYEAGRRASVLKIPTPYKVLGHLAPPELRVVPTKVVGPDYAIQAGGLSILMDAKDCTSERWQFSHLPDHQGDRFTRHCRQGGHAFVLLRLERKLLLLPWERNTETMLGARWRAWSQATTRAAPRTAGLDLGQAEAIGYTLHSIDWLPTAIAHTRLPPR